jgi:hypothetical protein
MIMATDTDGSSGALRRLMKRVRGWSETLEYSGIDYTFDRIASIERELAELKDRMRRLETSRHEPPDVPLVSRPAE